MIHSVLTRNVFKKLNSSTSCKTVIHHYVQPKLLLKSYGTTVVPSTEPFMKPKSNFYTKEFVRSRLSKKIQKYQNPHFADFEDNRSESLVKSLLQLVRSNNCALAEKKWQQLKELNDVKITADMYNVMIFYWGRENRLHKIDDALEEMRSSGIKPNQRTYAEAISAFASRGKTEQVRNLLSEMIKDGIPANTIIMNSVLLGLSKSKQEEALLKQFQEMSNSQNFQPNEKTYQLMMSFYSFKGDAKKTRQYFDLMMKNKIFYGVKSLLLLFDTLNSASYYSENDEKSLILHYFDLAKKASLVDTSIYNRALMECKRLGDDELLMTLLQEMQDKGFALDVTTVKTVISAFSKKGDVESIVKLLKKLQDQGMDLDYPSIKSIVNVMSQIKNVTKLEQFLHDIFKIGVRPNPFMLNSLLKAYSETNNWERVISHFEDMKKHTPKQISRLTFSYLIDACHTCNHMEVIPLVLQEMKDFKMDANDVILSSLIAAYSKGGQIEKAFDLLVQTKGKKREFVSPSVTKVFLEKLEEKMNNNDQTNLEEKKEVIEKIRELFSLIKEEKYEEQFPQKYDELLHSEIAHKLVHH